MIGNFSEAIEVTAPIGVTGLRAGNAALAEGRLTAFADIAKIRADIGAALLIAAEN